MYKNKIMITEKVLRLKADIKLNNGLDFKAGQEFVIANDVVIMSGFPLPAQMQDGMYTWLTKNPNLFLDDTRQW